MTSESSPGAPPSYCGHCHALVRLAEPPEKSEAACPSCGESVRIAQGRFAGIVNVVRFVDALTVERRRALQAALHQDQQADDASPSPGDMRWLTEWLAETEVLASPFWRRCLVLAVQLVPATAGVLSDQQIAALARDVARQAGASQSFTPRRY
ncbi:MAG: hypothetical protein ACJ735_12205 [Actinomycetes bacterium]